MRGRKIKSTIGHRFFFLFLVLLSSLFCFECIENLSFAEYWPQSLNTLEERLCWFRFSTTAIQQHETVWEKNQLLKAISSALCSPPVHVSALPRDSGPLSLQYWASLDVSAHYPGLVRSGWSPVGEHEEQESRRQLFYKWPQGSFRGLFCWHLNPSCPSCGPSRNTKAFQRETLSTGEVSIRELLRSILNPRYSWFVKIQSGASVLTATGATGATFQINVSPSLIRTHAIKAPSMCSIWWDPGNKYELTMQHLDIPMHPDYHTDKSLCLSFSPIHFCKAENSPSNELHCPHHQSASCHSSRRSLDPDIFARV